MIKGFSLTHFSGRGCNAYQDFPFTPTIGPIDQSPAFTGSYASNFAHGRETASQGYYSVHLDNTNIQVDMSVTPRTGFGRFTYPQSHAATLLINAGGSATGNTAATGVQIIGNDTVVGSATSGHFCGLANTYTVYFAAQFDQSFTQFGILARVRSPVRRSKY
jgi:putative alpha-1,2-mannosidase